MSKLEIHRRLEIARQKEDVYNNHIASFVKSREQVLFRAFCETDASNVEALQKIKMQHTVLVALEAEFIRHIDDGKMAIAELDKLE